MAAKVRPSGTARYVPPVSRTPSTSNVVAVASASSSCWRGPQRREWYEAVSTAEEEVATQFHDDEIDWFRTPWIKVPTIRFFWGDIRTGAEDHTRAPSLLPWCPADQRCSYPALAEEPLHAGPIELFMDLVFVGVAFRVGIVVESSVYGCETAHVTPGNASAARHLLPSASAGSPRECPSIYDGILTGLSPYLAMYQIWWMATTFKAKYSCASKLHTILDVANAMVSPVGIEADRSRASRGPTQRSRVPLRSREWPCVGFTSGGEARHRGARTRRPDTRSPPSRLLLPNLFPSPSDWTGVWSCFRAMGGCDRRSC